MPYQPPPIRRINARRYGISPKIALLIHASDADDFLVLFYPEHIQITLSKSHSMPIEVYSFISYIITEISYKYPQLIFGFPNQVFYLCGVSTLVLLLG